MAYIIFVWLFWSYSIDDAFITFRYAENVANGYGLVFNPGDQPVEGYSNFLWLLILAGAFKLGLPTSLAAKVLGVFFFSMAGYTWQIYFSREDNGLSWLAPILFLMSPFTAFWAVSGLELGLYAFLLAAAIIGLLARSRWLYLSLALLVLCRPEGFIIALVMVGLGALSDWRNHQLDKRTLIIQFATVIAMTAALMLFRLEIFGYPLPNTFYAKNHSDKIAGFLALAKMFVYLLPIAALFIWRLVVIAKEKRVSKPILIMAGLFLVQVVISSSVNPVMNFQFRYLVAYLPLLFAVALDATSGISRQRTRIAVVAVVIVSVLMPLSSTMATRDHEEVIQSAQQDAISFLAGLPDTATVALSDVGRIPYFSGKHFYDIWGLVDARTGHEGFNSLRSLMWFPDYFVMVGYIDEDGTAELRFGGERLIVQYDIFPYAYRLEAVGKPADDLVDEPGYHYLFYKKNQPVLDSILLVHPPPETY